MTEDDPLNRVTQAMNGPAQTKPDERRQYLGSLRERVALAITNAELKEPQTLAETKTFLSKYRGQKGYKVLLNGKLNVDDTAPYMQAAKAFDLPFTLVADDTAQTAPTAFAFLLVNADAINHENISLPHDLYTAPKKKAGFFDRFR